MSSLVALQSSFLGLPQRAGSTLLFEFPKEILKQSRSFF